LSVIAFTGHRPKDLPPEISYQQFAGRMDALLPRLELSDPLIVVAGGALGVDTWAAEWAISRKIELHLVLPFTPEVMGKWWGPMDRARLNAHMGMAIHTRILHEGAYDVAFYQRRNEAMVNLADVVVAVWSGKRGGGTWNCITYAHKQGKSIVNIFRDTPTRIGTKGASA
jgi:predicted Rossmann fold nucleotide-binding protein DprA/Smf involved in DNA uptake